MRAAARQDGDVLREVREPELLARLRPPEGDDLARGVAHVVRVDPAVAPERLLEGEHDRHPVDVPTKGFAATAPPRPDLRRAVPEHANAPAWSAGRAAR